jgi:5-oxopent-3-ene-1,2,5-tricarboxylate decarboxylase/2-hydroxyhepta-2,4-diene-1,7-dioate isomerase
MSTKEYRRILLDGDSVQTTLEGNELVTKDGRSIDIEEAQHLPPTQPSKIICVHLNYESRVKEYITKLPPAPTYFHKPITALNSHQGEVMKVRLLLLSVETVAILAQRRLRIISPAIQ